MCLCQTSKRLPSWWLRFYAKCWVLNCRCNCRCNSSSVRPNGKVYLPFTTSESIEFIDEFREILKMKNTFLWAHKYGEPGYGGHDYYNIYFFIIYIFHELISSLSQDSKLILWLIMSAQDVLSLIFMLTKKTM